MIRLTTTLIFSPASAILANETGPCVFSETHFTINAFIRLFFDNIVHCQVGRTMKITARHRFASQ